MTALTELPAEERPRERLLTQGADSLSLTELLAVCLEKGRRGASALHLAEELLSRFGSLSALFGASLAELTEIKGIGRAKAAKLHAIFALAKRSKSVGNPKCPISSPEDVYQLIASSLEGASQEKLMLMLRNARGELFHHEAISIGTVSEVLVHPREVFHHVLRHKAYSFILVHNHPTGDPEPSKADLELTRLIETSGKLMGIRLDDHLIIGKGAYTSMWERGLISRSKY